MYSICYLKKKEEKSGEVVPATVWTSLDQQWSLLKGIIQETNFSEAEQGAKDKIC